MATDAPGARCPRRLQTRTAPDTPGGVLSPPSPASAAGKGREARRAPRTMRRARTARPLTRSPSRARRMGWPAGWAGRQSQAGADSGSRCAPALSASARGPPRACAFVTVSSLSEPACRRRRRARGCKPHPLASVHPTSCSTRGRMGHLLQAATRHGCPFPGVRAPGATPHPRLRLPALA